MTLTNNSPTGLPMTEHHLQMQLTRRWLTDGISIAGETVTLVAWEVMLPSWQINDALRGFGQPAIDFLAVDTEGGLVAIELKMRIRGERAALRACCQVSHSAALIDKTRTVETLEQAHQACYGATHGRTGLRAAALPAVDVIRPTRAVLAAPVWSSTAAPTVTGFGRRSWAANIDHLREVGLLTNGGANRVCRRYESLSDHAQPAIETLVVEMPDTASS